ncbi:E3 ubiquitin-protein ligase RMND5A-like isoform X2 [Littorina saxatilis]|uniref:E3 ubiquitin-protein ligase RMND5A-like isoform X2 n=1 Tax=Littorina saxatilis TaxID=31220 RepID=UPI0038B48D6C
MEACAAVEKEVDRLTSKLTSLHEHEQRSLEEFINAIQDIKRELSEAPADHKLSSTQVMTLNQSLKRIRDGVSRISTEHKDLHSSVSKVGKTIDRNFISDFTAVLTEGACEGEDNQRLLNEVICEHFLRQGMLEIAEALNEDAGLNLSQERKEPFLELHRILEALKNKDLGPALQWAEMHRERLSEENSSLEFRLHRLYFIHLIRQGNICQREALLYARNFAPFASQHARELQSLMGSLLYLREGVENSPYSHLLEPIYWQEICDVFTKDACRLMGLSVQSPLSVCIQAGCQALPPLLSIRQVMLQRQVAGVWSNKEELPVEIDLGHHYHFHSIFACPILRQQSTHSNPPMRLVCGHVISKDALSKLSNMNKVKCPYCPVEQMPSEAKQIFF